MKSDGPMDLNPNQKYRWPVKEQVRFLNRCLYPQLKDIDERMAKIVAMNKYTDLALNAVREKLYRENNVPLNVI